MAKEQQAGFIVGKLPRENYHRGWRHSCCGGLEKPRMEAAGGLAGMKARRSPGEVCLMRESSSASSPPVLYCVSGTTDELELHLFLVLNEVLLSLCCESVTFS